MNITVLVADDNKRMRKILHGLLSEKNNITIVGDAATGHEVVHLAEEFQPDVIIMDVAMPDLKGNEVIGLIHATNHEVKVIAIGLFPYRNDVIKMMRAGATGYLTKDCSSVELVDAIQAALANEVYLSHRINPKVVHEVKQFLGTKTVRNPQSPRAYSDGDE